MRAAALLLLAAAAGAAEWTPVGYVTALGGLHAFDGARESFTGNVDAAAAPAAALGERWSLLPSARAVYEGTRRLTYAAGTGTVAEQRAEARLGLRAVYARPDSRWRFKPTASCSLELVRETKDEEWGRGLFDQRRVSAGAEAEVVTVEPYSIRLAADWFVAEFPRYVSLESRAAAQFPGRGLARELAGDRVLDRTGWRFGLAADAPLGRRVEGEGRLEAVWSRFPRQRVVEEGGQFLDERRQDVLLDGSLAARMPHSWNADLRALGSLELGVAANSSSQNGYDAARGRFLPGFYDFVEWRAAPAATLIVGPPRRPVSVGLRLGWRRRVYPRRPSQDAAGAYRGGSLSSTEWSLGASLTYPMAKRLSLVFDVQRASASSNQDFQAFYRHSYQATTALAGARWDW